MTRATTTSASRQLARPGTVIACGLCLLAAAGADPQPVQSDLDRADAAVRDAFAFLYALPSDTAAAQMGTWVLDSSATTRTGESTGVWQIVAARLSDTGDGLELREVAGRGGTSAAQLAESMAAMQRLEGKVSKAEAEASLGITVTLNATEVSVSGISTSAPRYTAVVEGAAVSIRVDGGWVRVEDRELAIQYERWAPATLLAGFGSFAAIDAARLDRDRPVGEFVAHARVRPAAAGIHTIGVTATGNQDMVERVQKETRWAALAALVN